MSHEIDLKKCKIHTDLVIEDLNLNKEVKKIEVISIHLDKKESLKYHKKEGNYITIEFVDVTDYQNREKIVSALTKELLNIYKLNNIQNEDSCLIVGLGNINCTPDSLGPLVIDKVLVTNYVSLCSELEKGFRKTYAFVPGVMANTGIETSDILISIIKKIKPGFLIIIDSLMSRSTNRLNKTIQITDVGITPGSVFDGKRKEISKKTMHIPVISIGIPTVIESSVIIKEALGKTINTNDTLMVTPKEIDFVIKKLSDVVSEGINKSLHKILR